MKDVSPTCLVPPTLPVVSLRLSVATLTWAQWSWTPSAPASYIFLAAQMNRWTTSSISSTVRARALPNCVRRRVIRERRRTILDEHYSRILSGPRWKEDASYSRSHRSDHRGEGTETRMRRLE